MIILTVLILVALATADLAKRPYVDGKTRKGLCYSTTVPTTIPTVSVFDVKSQLSNANGLVQSAFCNSLDVNDLFAFTSETVVDVDCTTSGFTTTLVVQTTPKVATSPPVLHELTCKFTVQIDNTCSDTKSGSGSGGRNDDDNDNRWQRNKRQIVFQDNLPCAKRANFTECFSECLNPPLGSFLQDCFCLYENMANPSNPNAPCAPGQVCCWNMPCERWDQQGSLQCLRGGGSVDGLTPVNCNYFPDGNGGGLCRCVDPLVPNPDYTIEILSTPNSLTALNAPFDCLCPYLTLADWLAQGATGQCGIPTAAPASVVQQAQLKLGLGIEALNVNQFTATCKPCNIKMGGFKASASLAAKFCAAFVKLVGDKKIPFLFQKLLYGCSIVTSQPQCPSLFKDANHIVGEDQLDQVPVEMLMDVEDVPAASSGSVATASVAVLIAAVARLL